MLLVRPRRTRSRVVNVTLVGLLAVLAGAAWLPFLHAPLTSDEGGFLYVAYHWRPGRSLYGDQWVDRPPLLIALFGLAAHFGAGGLGMVVPAVRLLGAFAVTVSVGLAGLLASVTAARVSPTVRWPRVAAPILAAALLASPLLGMPETDGEILALPFVLLSMTALVVSLDRPTGTRTMLLTALAGAAGMAAALVKQNIIDGLLFALVTILLTRAGLGPTLRRLAALAAGAGVTLGIVLAVASARGTSPAGIWEATVVFRFRAAAVLATESSGSTNARFGHLLRAFAASGAAAALVVAVVLVAVTVHHRRRRRPLLWATVVTVGWELFGAASGGSYWLHYLVALVPGLLMLVTLAGEELRGGTDRLLRRVLVGAVLTYAVVSSGVAWAGRVANPTSIGDDAAVISYLRTHAAAGDAVVVGFGHADIVAGSGLTSPYPDLWSLPVRVLDPRLTQLDALLDGPHAPRWVVVDGASLATWGVDATTAQADLERHYGEQAAYGDWHLWQRNGSAS
ncbi:MAG: hypothetical protein J2P57_05955 [Acidimicrobiaceae bacterium]|nr:hypothetical protein [Acidimicrobiaceae bacterium]